MREQDFRFALSVEWDEDDVSTARRDQAIGSRGGGDGLQLEHGSDRSIIGAGERTLSRE